MIEYYTDEMLTSWKLWKGIVPAYDDISFSKVHGGSKLFAIQKCLFKHGPMELGLTVNTIAQLSTASSHSASVHHRVLFFYHSLDFSFVLANCYLVNARATTILSERKIIILGSLVGDWKSG